MYSLAIGRDDPMFALGLKVSTRAEPYVLKKGLWY
jgi:hypothetical protein